MPRQLSCGVICRTSDGRILLCHPTGQDFWDIPKGKLEEGETERQAATRELYEEAGILVHLSRLIPLGRYKYNPKKDLYLYVHDLPEDFKVEDCKCTSTFDTNAGITLTEMDAFVLVTPQEALHLASKSLNKVLQRLIEEEVLL